MSKLPLADCEHCSLRDRSLVPGYGPTHPQVVIVGEAPGYDEARTGRPFVGRSGQLLRQVLDYVGISPEWVYYTNVVACHPMGNQLPEDAVVCCKPRLMEELKQFVPLHVPFCAVGAVSAQILTRTRDTITSLRGRWHRDGRVFATWHPAAVLRTPDSMREFLMDMRKLATGGPQKLPVPMWSLLASEDIIESFIKQLLLNCRGQTLCYDIETEQTTFWKHPILCLGIAYDVDNAAVIPGHLLYHDRVKKALTDLFDPNNGLAFVGHNVKFDMRFLRRQLGIPARAEHDTYIAHYALAETARHALKPLLMEYFDIEDYEQVLVAPYLTKKNDLYSKVPLGSLMEYNAFDVAYNLRLWFKLKEELESAGVYERPYLFPMMASQDPLLEMELHGVVLDAESLLSVSSDMQDYLDDLLEELQTLCGYEFNPRSPKQVQPIMFEHYHMPRVRGRNYAEGSTCADAREKILPQLSPDSEAYRWLKLYGWYRSLTKVKSSYVDPMFEQITADGRVHVEFSIPGTETGRLSAHNPPLHSIPKPERNEAGQPDWGLAVRGAFVAPPGYRIVVADYSQAEMRVAAGYSNDAFLLEQYQAGNDLHNETARALYGDNYTKRQRQTCKSYNFSQIYGGTIYSFAAEAGLNIKEAQAFAIAWQKRVPGLTAWKANQFVTARKQGYVETIFGRRRRFPLVTQANLDEVRKACVNAPIQGTASDLTLISVIELHKLFKGNLRVHLLLTVHDSIVLEVEDSLVNEVAEVCKKTMEDVGGRYFPQLPWVVDIEVGSAWGVLEKWTPAKCLSSEEA